MDNNEANEQLKQIFSSIITMSPLWGVEAVQLSTNKLIINLENSDVPVTLTGMAFPMNDEETFFYIKVFAPTNKASASEILETQALAMSPYGIDVMMDEVSGDALGLSCCMPVEDFDFTNLTNHLTLIHQLAVWVNAD